jgi:carboxylesterase type B
MFGILDRSWRPKEPHDYELEAQCVSYWANFIQAGNPNSSSLPEWPGCQKEGTFVMELG